MTDQTIEPINETSTVLLCTVTEAATRLNVSSEEIRRRIRQGTLNAKKSRVNGRQAYVVELEVNDQVPSTTITAQLALIASKDAHLHDLQAVIASQQANYAAMLATLEERHRDDLKAAKADADRVRKIVTDELIEAHQRDLDRAEDRHRAEIDRLTPPPARPGWFDWLLGR